ncbi:L-aminoadipate-semialdehyde dehydrogenase-phosphopantetheinyl transferase [Bemisia tabaci]|uniref:L-aminoadipate-semialdehyde dehydrogenase-phosphopantetheinyl transferase n=1 Tax=Bemisia tabaci TaxID=7038 RepID=UPI003B2865F4
MQLKIHCNSHIVKMSLKSARWAFDCKLWNPSEDEWRKTASFLQEDEKQKVKQFYFQRDAKSCLIGRLLMRKFLTLSSGLPWSEIQIIRDQHNKPLCLNNPQLHFNVSHQGNFTVLAGEVGSYQLGIDIMKNEVKSGKRLEDFFRIMRRVMTPSEWEQINSCSTELDKNFMFYRFWCLKESYVKAIGVGLNVNLQDLRFKVNSLELVQNQFTTDTQFFLKDSLQSTWTFYETLLDPAHCVAIGIHDANSGTSNFVDKFTTLTLDDLISEAEQISTPDSEFSVSMVNKPLAP